MWDPVSSERLFSREFCDNFVFFPKVYRRHQRHASYIQDFNTTLHRFDRCIKNGCSLQSCVDFDQQQYLLSNTHASPSAYGVSCHTPPPTHTTLQLIINCNSLAVLKVMLTSWLGHSSAWRFATHSHGASKQPHNFSQALLRRHHVGPVMSKGP
jgi:hypothetical protein